jgi:hypothetical protein
LESTEVGQDEVECAADDAIVLRGGDLSGASRELNLRNVHEKYGLWGICATASVEPLNALAKQVRAGNRRLMPGLTKDLRHEGFDVIREPGHDWPDALILFKSRPDESDWERLRTIMSRQPSVLNPNYRGK